MMTVVEPMSTYKTERSIGRLGTLGRVVVGIFFLALGIIGLPPWGHLLGWPQVLLGLIALPALAALAQLMRLAFTRAQIRAAGDWVAIANFGVLAALLIPEPTRGATLVFLGASMLVAALRGRGGCESLAVSNWLLRREDEVGCALFTPLDRFEARSSRA